MSERRFGGRLVGMAAACSMVAVMGAGATPALAAALQGCVAGADGAYTCTLDDLTGDVMLSEPGAYTLTGTLSGHSVIAGSGVTGITLDGATIAGADGKPALDLSAATGDVALTLADMTGTKTNGNTLTATDGQPGIKLGATGTVTVTSPTQFDYEELQQQADANAIKLLTVNGGTNASGIQSAGATLKVASGALSANGNGNGAGVTAPVVSTGGLLDANGTDSGNGITGNVTVTSFGFLDVSAVSGTGVRGAVSIENTDEPVGMRKPSDHLSIDSQGNGIEGNVSVSNSAYGTKIYAQNTGVVGNVSVSGDNSTSVQVYVEQGPGVRGDRIEVSGHGANLFARSSKSSVFSANEVVVSDEGILTADDSDDLNTYGIDAKKMSFTGNSEVHVSSFNQESFATDSQTCALVVKDEYNDSPTAHVTAYGHVVRDYQVRFLKHHDFTVAQNSSVTFTEWDSVNPLATFEVLGGSTITLSGKSTIYKKLTVDEGAKIINTGVITVLSGATIEGESRIQNVDGGKIVYEGGSESGTKVMVGAQDKPAVTVPEGMSGLKDSLGGVSADLADDARNAAKDTDTTTAKNKLTDAGVTVGESDTVSVVVKPYFDITATSYNADNGVLALDITPKARTYATTATTADQMNPADGNGKNAVLLEDKKLEVSGPVTVSVPLPDGFLKDRQTAIYVRHDKSQEGGTVHLHKATVKTENDKTVATFTTTDGFSPFTFEVKADPAAQIDGTYYDTLQAAVDAVTDKGTITVLKKGLKASVKGKAVGFSFTISGTESGSVTITDANGNTLTATNGTFTVPESKPVTPPTPPTPPVSPSVTPKIEVTSKPTKTEYKIGEKFDPAGLVVKRTDSSGAVSVLDASQYTISGFDSSKPGTVKVTVTLNADKTRTATFKVTVEASEMTVHRLYLKATGEHFYTASEAEWKSLAKSGWREEGVAFTMSDYGTPVYRLYLPGGKHMFTTSKAEYEHLKASGWRDEGVAFRVPEGAATKVYRLYNTGGGDHLFTTNWLEYTALRILPWWRGEGVAFDAK